MTAPVFSVVVPAYNEEEVIAATHERLSRVMDPLGAYEIIYVDDGSRDGTLSILASIANNDRHVRVLSFSRNFGHQAAVTAGMANARGDAVVLIDADLQDPPEVIKDMAEEWRKGADVCYGQRTERKGETFFKKFTAKVYYGLFRKLSGSKTPMNTGDFRLMDRKVVDVMNSMPEHNRYLRGMVAWVGFKQVAVPFVRQERAAGETKYTLKKMLRLASDGIISFSDRPLLLPLGLGVAVAGVSSLGLLAELIAMICGARIAWIYPLTTALAAAVGILMINLGIMGAYLSRVYDEAKARPTYIIQWTMEGDDNNDR